MLLLIETAVPESNDLHVYIGKIFPFLYAKIKKQFMKASCRRF
jgi:hypothetical protein